MNDEIIGIAILSDASPHDGYEYLFVLCSSPSRKTVTTAAIPVRAAGLPNPDNKGWTYRERGEFLDCSPSLKMSTTVPADVSDPNGAQKEIEVFHGAGSWSVPFIRKTLDECSGALRALNYKLRDELRQTFSS